MAQPADHRSFEAPDEVRQLPNGRAEVVKIAVRDRAVGLRAAATSLRSPVGTTPGSSVRTGRRGGLVRGQQLRPFWPMSGGAVEEPSELAGAGPDLARAMSSIGDTCVPDATGPSSDGARHVGPDEVSRAWAHIRRPVAPFQGRGDLHARRPRGPANGGTTGTEATSAAWTCSRSRTAGSPRSCRASRDSQASAR